MEEAVDENSSRINTGQNTQTNGGAMAAGSDHNPTHFANGSETGFSEPAPDESLVPGAYTDEENTHMGMEAYFEAQEINDEVIPIHDARSFISTHAPSGGRMDTRSVGSETG
eukprot:10187995-Karenia_brevis.AAC.1